MRAVKIIMITSYVKAFVRFRFVIFPFLMFVLYVYALMIYDGVLYFADEDAWKGSRFCFCNYTSGKKKQYIFKIAV